MILLIISLLVASVSLAHPHAKRSNDQPLVDVHAHFTPDFYRDLLGGQLVGGNPVATWNISNTFAAMEAQGIVHTVLSGPVPNLVPNNESSTVRITQQLNDYAANLSSTYPDKISFFGLLPLPFVNASVAEIARLKGAKGLRGFHYFTNAEGYYPGNASWIPVHEALDELNATVFVHPNTPTLDCSCAPGGTIVANPLTSTPVATLEFFQDTARAFTDLFIGNIAQNFTNINYIVPQVGGNFPTSVDRTLGFFIGFLGQSPSVAATIIKIMQTRFWWESAGPSYPHQVAAVRAFDVPWSQMLFGTDFPAIPLPAILQNTGRYRNYTGFSDEDRIGVSYANAKKLLNLPLP